MRQVLTLHPDSRCSAATSIEVELALSRVNSLVLSYIVTGKTNDIRLPLVAAAVRRDELWQHTCFEAFIHASAGAEYYEFNFAPSTQWAAYRFTSYRTGMSAAAEIAAIQIETDSRPDRYTLQAALPLDRLNLPRTASWRLGLSAMIEDTSGRKSYWALAHPPGKPDFHHAACFGCEFSPVLPP